MVAPGRSGSSAPSVTASVIIPVKNGGPLLARVLQGVLRQDAPWPFEVLVIDSGSRDGSVETVRRLGLWVHQIPPSEFGHGRTRNLGVRLTRGEFVVFITQDALPADETWLAELVAGVRANPDVAGAFGPHLPYPEAGPVTARELDAHFAGFGRSTNSVRLDDPDRYARDPGYRQFLHYFSNNNSCLRRSVWEQISFPEVDFAEDQLWARAVVEAGYAKAYVPTARVYHSHEFGILEGARRAFDEARALKAHFGYDLMPCLSHLGQQWGRITARNARWIWESALPIGSRINRLGRTPFEVLGRLAGYYLGGHQDKLPASVTERVSRDKRLQRA